MEKHYYDPGTMISAPGNSRMACWQSIRKECRERGLPPPALSDLVEAEVSVITHSESGKWDVVSHGPTTLTVSIADDYTPWKEFSPDMLKDGAELLIRISGGEHIHVHVAEIEPKVVLRSAWNDEIVHIVPLREITHAFVINPPKP